MGEMQIPGPHIYKPITSFASSFDFFDLSLLFLMRTTIILILTALCLVGCARTKNQATLRIDRTFHKPLIFQIESEGAATFLRTIVYDGLGGYDKGKVQSDSRRALSATEATSVRSALAAVEASSPSDPIPSGGHDGSMWSYSGGGLWPKKMKIWSPQDLTGWRGTQPFFDLGLLLWRLSKIAEPEKDLY
jgi:hypothetical protein